VSGHGLALAQVGIEQDAAYWECAIEGEDGGASGSGRVKFGLATKKDRKFYSSAASAAADSSSNNAAANVETAAAAATAEPEAGSGGGGAVRSKQDTTTNNTTTTTIDGGDDGTEFMCPVPIQVTAGDVIGVAVQQDDFPMIQFYLNGELSQPNNSVNRFRGNGVYPAVYIAEPTDDDNDNNNDAPAVTVRFVFAETDFRHQPPSSRYSPVMVARGLV
jgi:hypothetical protein